MNDKDGNCLLILISHIPVASIMLQLLYSTTLIQFIAFTKDIVID